MGQIVRTECLECGEHFEMSRGGGFTFHQIGCDTCGKTTTICFAALGDVHRRYLKGLSGPYCLATAEDDARLRDDPEIEPISTEEYHRQVEGLAGRCPCGGRFTFAAAPRCPKCHSTRLAEGAVVICYD
jgi:hypothetical protein